MDGTVFRGTDDGYYARADHRHPVDTSRAALHSPNFSGEPTAPIAPDNSNDDRIATTQWVRQNVSGAMFGTSTTVAATAIKVVTLQSSFMTNPVFMRQIGSTIVIRFTHSDTSTAVTQLAVHGTPAAPVIYEGANVSREMIGANQDHIFTFDGTSWKLLNPVSVLRMNGSAIGLRGNTPPQGDSSTLLATTEWINANVVGVMKGSCLTLGANRDKIVGLHSSIMQDQNIGTPVLQKGTTVVVRFLERNMSETTRMNVQSSGFFEIHYEGKDVGKHMYSLATS
jgi:hypothetical protein